MFITPILVISGLCITVGINLLVKTRFKNRNALQRQENQISSVAQNQDESSINQDEDLYKKIINQAKELDYERSQEFKTVVTNFINFYQIQGINHQKSISENSEILDFLKYTYSFPEEYAEMMITNTFPNPPTTENLMKFVNADEGQRMKLLRDWNCFITQQHQQRSILIHSNLSSDAPIPRESVIYLDVEKHSKHEQYLKNIINQKRNTTSVSTHPVLI